MLLSYVTVSRYRRKLFYVLFTGATGFIGAHTCVELLNAGYDVIGINNFINLKPIVLNKIEQITGCNITFY